MSFPPVATVTFNHPLKPGPLDLGNWFVRKSNNRYSIDVASALGNQVTISAINPFGDPGPDVVSYAASPADVISDTARQIPAPAFADYPLV